VKNFYSTIITFTLGLVSFPACKTLNVGSQTKIVGGFDNSESVQRGFFASLIIDRDLSSQNIVGICGGTFIHERIVLTAAHCVRSVDKGFHKQIVVIPRTSEEDKTTPIPEIQVIGQVVHDGYPGKEGYAEDDIALLFLEDWKPRYPNIKVTPTSLNTDQNLGTRNWSNPTVATAIGLGNMTSIGTVMAPVPQAAFLDITPIESCLELPEIAEHKDRLLGKFLCTGGTAEDGKSVCLGDSGGPLVIEQDGHNVLVGIVSGGSPKGCAQKMSFTLYTNVAHYTPWIQDKISNFLPELQHKLHPHDMMAHCQKTFRETTEEKKTLDFGRALIKNEYFADDSGTKEAIVQGATAGVNPHKRCSINKNSELSREYYFKDPDPASPKPQEVKLYGYSVNSQELRQWPAIKQTSMLFNCSDTSGTIGFLRYYPFTAGTYPSPFGQNASFHADGFLISDNKPYMVAHKVADTEMASVNWKSLCQFNSVHFELGTSSTDDAAYLRSSGTAIPQSIFALRPEDLPQITPNFHIIIHKKSDKSGEMTLENISSVDLFTWKLACAEKLQMQFLDESVATQISPLPEKSDRPLTHEETIMYLKKILLRPKTDAFVDFGWESEVLFRHPQDSGSAIPAKGSLKFSYAFPSATSQQGEPIERSFNHCRINGEAPVVSYQ